MMKSRFLFAITITLLLCGCGFHLRGQQSFPAQLKQIHLVGNNPYGEFESDLKSTLNAVGLHVVKPPQTTNITLRIISARLTHNEPTVGGSNQARLYTFRFGVTFELTNQKGKVILSQQTLHSSENLTLNPDQLLGSNNQADLLRKELYHDVITQLLDRLSSEHVFSILNRQDARSAGT